MDTQLGDVSTDLGPFAFGITELSGRGKPLSPPTGYILGNSNGLPGAYLDSPHSIAIDPSGNVWIANTGIGTVLEMVGTAAPVETPVIGPVRRP
jgi:hypothetical protein